MSVVDIAFLIGNGFDLSAGLHTEVTSFIGKIANAYHGEDSPAGRLARQIEREGIEAWSDFEKKLGEYSSVVSHYENVENPQLEFLEAKDVIDRQMRQIIEQQDGRITDSFVEENASVCLGSINNWYAKLPRMYRKKINDCYSSNRTFRYSFITFNYTSLLNRLVEYVQPNPFNGLSLPSGITSCELMRLYPVHGTLGDVPVCGVDGVDQISAGDFGKNFFIRRSMVKPDIAAHFGRGIDLDAMNAICNSEIIIILGLSIGATDRRWWKAIIEQLKRSDAYFLIVCDYRAGERFVTPYADVKASEAIKLRLFESAGFEGYDPEGSVASRIFVVPSTGILSFDNPLNDERA